MLKTVPTPTTSGAQLLSALLASIQLLLVALSLIVLVAVLFVRSFVGIAMVLLQAANLLLGSLVALVASVEEVKSFARFLATAEG